MLSTVAQRTKGAADSYGKTLPGEIKVADAELHNLGTTFGEFLTPKIEEAGKALEEGIGWLEKHTAEAKIAGGAIAGVLGVAVAVFAEQKAVKFAKSVGNMLGDLHKLEQGAVSVGKKLLGLGSSETPAAAQPADQVAQTGDASEAASSQVAQLGDAASQAEASLGAWVPPPRKPPAASPPWPRGRDYERHGGGQHGCGRGRNGRRRRRDRRCHRLDGHRPAPDRPRHRGERARPALAWGVDRRSGRREATWHFLDSEVVHPIEAGFKWLKGEIKSHLGEIEHDVKTFGPILLGPLAPLAELALHWKAVVGDAGCRPAARGAYRRGCHLEPVERGFSRLVTGVEKDWDTFSSDVAGLWRTVNGDSPAGCRPSWATSNGYPARSSTSSPTPGPGCSTPAATS